MKCLNDVEIQAVADGESSDAHRDHAASCERCRPRADARRREMSRLAAMAADGDAPPALEARVRQAVASAQSVRGATALRGPHPSRQPLGWISAAATAAAIGMLVFVVLPRFGAPTRLSAAQVIGRSLDRLTTGTGVEILEYEVVFSSASSPQHGFRWPEGLFRIYQLFDRASPGRYHIEQYNPDGTLHSATSQNPVTHVRSDLVEVDGRRYIIRVTGLKDPLLSVPEIVQAQIEAVLTMMQATADESLTIVDRPEGRQYIVNMPGRPSLGDKAMLDLSSARAVIDEGDFTIREFHAAGSMLKQPFDISFRLIQQVKAAAVAPGDFDITARPGDVVLEGQASIDPFHDVMDIVLRELGREQAR